MLFSDIIHDVRSQLNEPDANNSHFTDAELLAWGNECTEQLCSLMHTYPKTSLADVKTVDSTITLDDDLVSVDYVSIRLYDTNDALETKHRPLVCIDFDNFVRYNPDWENTQNGVPNNNPKWFVRMGAFDWFIYPLKDSIPGMEYPLTVIGRVLPTPISATTSAPPVSRVLHPAYIYYILWKAWPRLNNTQKSLEAFKAYDTLRVRNNRTATQTQSGGLRFRTEGL